MSIAMMGHLNTIQDVIDVFGGRAAIAEALEVKPNAVSNWTTAGQFPAALYLLVQEELKIRNLIAPDFLFKMRRRKKRRKN